MPKTGIIKKILTLGKNYLLLYLLLLAFFILSLTAVCALPGDAIRNNIKASIPTFEREGDYPRIGAKQPSNGLDNWADSSMLNIIYNIDNRHPLNSALAARLYLTDTIYYFLDLRVNSLKALVEQHEQPNVEYSRYWHGYMLIIRPLLSFVPYPAVRLVMQIVFYLLFAAIVALLAKRVSISLALAFTISMILVNLPIIPLSIQFSSVFFVAIASMIILVLFPGMSPQKACLLFFAIGASTSFVDLLTAPLVTFGLPVVVLLFLRRKNHPPGTYKTELLFLLSVFLSWAMGYLLLWASKWLLANLVTDKNIFLEAVQKSVFWTGNQISTGADSGVILSLDGLVNNIGVLITYSLPLSGFFFLLLPSLSLLIILRWHRKWADLKLSILLILVGLTPYAWFILTSNHSFVHSWYTYRIQAITIFSFWGAFSYAIDWQRILADIRKTALKNRKTG